MSLVNLGTKNDFIMMKDHGGNDLYSFEVML